MRAVTTNSLASVRTRQEILSHVGPGSGRTAALLLLMSRETLSAAEQATARRLAREVESWPDFVNVAHRLRGLAFVNKHITDLDLLPPEQHFVGTWMHDTVTKTSFRWLGVARAQANFLDDCIAPLGVPHVFLKGLTLALYYDNPSLRLSRDIDILVEPKSIRPILDRAREAGYRVMLDPKAALAVETADDLEAVLALKDDIPLMSPEGVVIEVHRSLHEDLPDASISTIIDEAQDAEIANRTYRVLPTGPMFPYLCAHHTRHLWDTPNYIADIAAIRNHASWDADEVADWAARFNLDHVVAAALEFDTASRSGDLPKDGMAGIYAAYFALHVGDTEDAHDMLEQEFKAVNRWVHCIDKAFGEVWTVFLRQFVPTLADYIQHRVPIRKKLFYRALGVVKIVGKSGRRLLGAGTR